jgi:ubiquinone/menaquinone biosynthesis C-methylase UbiE
MKPQGLHSLLPQQTYDEDARERCVASLRKLFSTELIPGNRELYETRLRPEFSALHGREPASEAEVKALMDGTFYYRASSLIGRATQELLWDTVGENVERQLDSLNARARVRPDARGTLTLDPNLVIPDYVEAVDIHVMPGNFHTELSSDDVLAGAMYDRGAYLFAYGSRGAYNDNLGRLVALLLRERFPDFRPRRILEMGCGCGSSTLPIKEAWPEAEVYAIDVAAPMLRYAHGRAESLGVPIHFSQQNAACTNFPDGYFDLVLSIIVHHEMPLDVGRGMLRECYRLLAPGGITVHDGTANSDRPDAPDPFQEFLGSWFARHNNEPYGVGFDIERDLVAAGFRREDLFSGCPEGDEYLKGHIAAHSYVGAVRR